MTHTSNFKKVENDHSYVNFFVAKLIFLGARTIYFSGNQFIFWSFIFSSGDSIYFLVEYFIFLVNHFFLVVIIYFSGDYLFFWWNHLFFWWNHLFFWWNHFFFWWIKWVPSVIRLNKMQPHLDRFHHKTIFQAVTFITKGQGHICQTLMFAGIYCRIFSI